MSGPNIVKACNRRGLKPVCNHAHYATGACTMVGGPWYFSYPPHDRRYGVPPKKVKGAFFYSGNRNNSLLNTGRTHRWSRYGRDRDGDTFCVKRGKTYKNFYKYKGITMYRVSIKGRMR